MPARMEFDVQLGRSDRPRARRGSLTGPMRILLMGNLSGTGAAPSGSPAAGSSARRTHSVDVDNFEKVMARLSPCLRPGGETNGQAGASIEFRSLDDFHPDALYRRLAIFEPLRTLRARLLDPATAAAAIAALVPGRPEAPVADSTGPAAQDPLPRGSREDDQTTLERLLGARPVNVARSAAGLARGQVNLDRFLHDIVAPDIVQGAGPEQRELVDAVDLAAGALMRTVLHDGAFQEMEALWRSIHGLVVNLETGEDLQLHLLDLSDDALESELAAMVAEPSSSSLFRLLVEESPGAPGERPWSLLVGNYRFGAGERDARMLATVGAVAAQAGAPFLAAADPCVLGCRSSADLSEPARWVPPGAEDAARWAGLRSSRHASWIGLALPRILLRLPYGRETDEVERFSFEEMVAQGHENYLWGNPAFACARLLGESHAAAGAAMQPGDHLDLGDLPAHTRPTGDGPALQACAEVFLPERAADAILKRGLMPLMSFRNRNMVRLMRFQSIAEPPAPLSGFS